VSTGSPAMRASARAKVRQYPAPLETRASDMRGILGWEEVAMPGELPDKVQPYPSRGWLPCCGGPSPGQLRVFVDATLAHDSDNFAVVGRRSPRDSEADCAARAPGSGCRRSWCGTRHNAAGNCK
jgi:hypothetical protein